jgi:hypothetical protein
VEDNRSNSLYSIFSQIRATGYLQIHLSCESSQVEGVHGSKFTVENLGTAAKNGGKDGLAKQYHAVTR